MDPLDEVFAMLSIAVVVILIVSLYYNIRKVTKSRIISDSLLYLLEESRAR